MTVGRYHVAVGQCGPVRAESGEGVGRHGPTTSPAQEGEAEMADRESGAQIWGAAVVVASALAVVAAYLINGAALVLLVAGVEVLLLMVYAVSYTHL